MSTATISRVESLLESALEDVDDDETRFKLRTALQLVAVIRDQHGQSLEIIEQDCANSSDVFDRLRELGYVE